MSEITINEVDELFKNIAKVEAEISEVEAVLTGLNKVMNQLKYRGMAYLKELGRTEYESPVGKMEIKSKWKVRMPENDLDKLAFFEHLKERGVFERYATVHAGSLNAYYKAEWDIAKSNGEGM